MSTLTAFQRACRARPLSMFLSLVAVISAGMLALARVIPGAESPEGFPGFLVWLPAVWSPNIAALLVARGRGELRGLLARLVRRPIPRRVWILALAPLAVAAVIVAVAAATGRGAHWDRLGPVVLLLLLAINLPLGPLGEELGWRGFLQPRLDARLGPGRSALVVGSIWALWHLPLWTIDSPQSQIPFLLFSAHVLCYSFTLSALVRRAGGGLIPAVIFHLLVNVVTGAVAVAGLAEPATWFAWSLPGYAAAAAWSWRALARPAGRGQKR
jgi:uncharacterized protein